MLVEFIKQPIFHKNEKFFINKILGTIHQLVFRTLHKTFDFFFDFLVPFLIMHIKSYLVLGRAFTKLINKKGFETLSFRIHSLSRTDLNSCKSDSFYTKSPKLSQKKLLLWFFKVNGIIYFLRLYHSFDMLHCTVSFAVLVHKHPLYRLVCGVMRKPSQAPTYTDKRASHFLSSINISYCSTSIAKLNESENIGSVWYITLSGEVCWIRCYSRASFLISC